jgi:hypothetical protein
MRTGRWNSLILLVAGTLSIAYGTIRLLSGADEVVAPLAFGLALCGGSVWLRRKHLD